MSNLTELTKGGQPATALGAGDPNYPSLDERFPVLDGPGKDYGRHIAETGKAVDEAIIRERAATAFSTALGMGFGPTLAREYQRASEQAARQGMRNGIAGLPAGRVHHTFQGTLSILLPTGGYYDPVKPTDIGNNPGGND